MDENSNTDKTLAPIFNSSKRKRRDPVSTDHAISDDDSSEPACDEVSNKDILQAITGLTSRIDGIESNVAGIVDAKLTVFRNEILEDVEKFKNICRDKILRFHDVMDERLLEYGKELNTMRMDDCAEIASKVQASVMGQSLSANCVATESRIDQLERQARMNELVISGIPLVEKEDLAVLMTEICKAIKFSSNSECIQSQFRLPLGNNVNKSNRRRIPSIIVRFWSADAKRDFFKHYINSKTLCTSMIGFSVRSRIYVNENLTKKNFEIFRIARQGKADGKLYQFNTYNGRVFVKVLAVNRLIGVDSIEHLDSLMVTNAAVKE